jgi:hypothetical protein
MSGVVGIAHDPWRGDGPLADRGGSLPRRALRRSLAWRANPREPEYMRALFGERFPDGRIVERVDELHGADRIVLLYPDANGIGFGALERKLPETDVVVLNGRRRQFALTARTRRALRLRRALELSYAGELLGLVALALATPVVAAWDLGRGRR